MPPEENPSSTPVNQTSPDYSGLVNLLMKPLLESPQSLHIDCEYSVGGQRIWIRVAFEGEDKGRVFGRGGRNVQAIRTVLNSAANLAGQSVYLDIYEDKKSLSKTRGDRDFPTRRGSGSRSPSRRPRGRKSSNHS